MHNSSSLYRSIFVASIAALLFSGCSANGSQFNPVAAPVNAVSSTDATKIQPDIEIDLTYSIVSGNCIVTYVYDKYTHQYMEVLSPVGCDAGGPWPGGIVFQASSAHWFIGQSSASGNVIAVENTKGKQLGTLTGLTGIPVGIASDSSANVWATNYPSNTINEYNAGATTPTATYTDGNLSSLRYIAVDQSNNVYVSGQSAGSGGLEVDELQGSAFTPIKTISGSVGAGIAISPKTQTLWVCDEGNGTSGTISGYSLSGFTRRMHFAYSGDDTGIAVAPSGREIYAVQNAAYGSEFNVRGVVYSAKTGKVLSTTPNLLASAPAVGISNHK